MADYKVIQKNLRFPDAVVSVIEKEAKTLGFNFNEYVKYMVTKKAETLMKKDRYSDMFVNDVIDARFMSKKGLLKKFKTKKEISDHLDSLLEDGE